MISLAQATSYAQAAGFSGRSLDFILAIAQAESGLDPLARNTNTDGSIDRGILQINNKWHPEYSDAQCDDPAEAFRAGWVISGNGSNFTPWSTFTNGAYRAHLPSIAATLPNALHFSEFQGGYHGTCGETALATALVCSTPPIESTQDAINLMLSMTKEMIGLGWADSSGATTTQHLHDEAVRRGFHPNSPFIAFQNSIDPDFLHNALLWFAGVKPVVIEIARAYALPGDEAGVHYHFICVVGITPQGYLVNDGDNNQAGAHLVTYSWAQIEAAAPCGLLVLDMQQQQGIPAGWHDDGSILTAPNGKTVQFAFRSYILAHPNWPPALMPSSSDDVGIPGGTQHDFTMALQWDGQVSEVAGPLPPPSVKPEIQAAQSALQAALAKLG